MTPSPDRSSGVNRTHLRIGAVVVVVASLAVAWQLGVLDVLTDATRLRDSLRALGGWGYAAYLAAFILLQPFGIPGVAMILGATYVWPKPIAFGLSFAGALGASTLGFVFARFVARDWVSARIPARLRKYDERIAEGGLLTTIVMRLVFWMNPFLHGLFGLSKIRFSTYVLGCAIAYAPTIAVIVWLGGSIIERLSDIPLQTVGWWIAAAVVIVVALRVYKWRAAKRARAAQPSGTDPPPMHS